MTHAIAIVGDRFMLPSFFERALRDKTSDTVSTRTLELPWPDEPMHHGYAEEGLQGLKEYMGDPQQVVDFLGDADIFITHLAPISADMFKPHAQSSPDRGLARQSGQHRHGGGACPPLAGRERTPLTTLAAGFSPGPRPLRRLLGRAGSAKSP